MFVAQCAKTPDDKLLCVGLTLLRVRLNIMFLIRFGIYNFHNYSNIQKISLWNTTLCLYDIFTIYHVTYTEWSMNLMPVLSYQKYILTETSHKHWGI